MDRRQQKTRTAIFDAFRSLLKTKSYNQITVQEIIDKANIGRSTFYAHFETKDALLQAICKELFGHIISSAMDAPHTQGRYSHEQAPRSVFCHLLQHLQQDDANILELLCCESSDIFLRYFKDSLRELVQTHCIQPSCQPQTLPQEFLINHIAGSFVEMVLWWSKDRQHYTPEQLDGYFNAVIQPILSGIHP